MSAKSTRWWRRLLVRDFLSPKGFLVTAAEVGLLFLVLHVAGFRSYTSILIGAPAAPGMAGRLACGLGLAYAVFYFAFVLLVPILAIAAGIFQALVLLHRSSRLSTREGSTE